MNKPFIFGRKKEGIKEPTLTQEQLQEAIKNSTKYLMPRSNGNVEYILPPYKEEELRNLIKESTKNLFPQPNDDVEFVVPLFDAREHYKHLKKQIWKFSRKY